MFKIEPGDAENPGLIFENNQIKGNIPKEYIPSVEKGLKIP